MKFIVDGKTIEVPDQLLVDAGNHAESRGMTLDEYIAEAFTLLKEKPGIIPSYAGGKYTEVHKVKSLDTKAPVYNYKQGFYEPEQSCGGTPEGWIDEKTFQKEKNLKAEQLALTDLNYDGDLDYSANSSLAED